MPLDQEGRRLRAQAGGLACHSKIDSHAHAAKMREGLKQKYLKQVDPDEVLPIEERERRAAMLRRSDLSKIALKRHQKKLEEKARQEAELWPTAPETEMAS